MGMSNRNRLVEILEKSGVEISNSMWDLLLFNISTLEKDSDGRVFYLSIKKLISKRVARLINEYNDAIAENFTYIMKG